MQASGPRMFPLQTSKRAPAGPLSIPWAIAEVAYGEYAKQYGRGQSLERLAERGGFGWCEMDTLHPGWRKEVSVIERLTAAVKSAQEFQERLASTISKAFHEAEEGNQGDDRLLALAHELDGWMRDGFLASYRNELEAALSGS